ncbi:Hsp20/alpha crystallin family protein [Nitrosospira sp. Nsp13]|uniref:Hsp20/alpha crystallin family protein n=1 Tax=Nitrosospira sp. Nsp13 TaxID=1855332 RepID=UPI00088ABF3F|nr:Hsp20/alpha crystallin family protein [Nitrosospira sp. Nsp13]SCY39118.1 HSP20 family protein [Nitrosospira sp. Nsp13]
MANITRRSPIIGDIARFDPFYNIEDWFNWPRNFGMRPFSMEMENAPTIKMDLSESDTAYTVRAEIPGVKKEDVNVQIDGNRVSISAETRQEKEEKEGERVICRECHQGSAYRSFSLNSDVDESKAEAKYENGTLELTLPKKNGKTAKQIEIK